MADPVGGVSATASAESLFNSGVQSQSLDDLSADALRSAELKLEFAQSSDKILETVTDFQFDSPAVTENLDKGPALFANATADVHSANLLGSKADPAIVADDVAQDVSHMVRDLALATTKTLVAWQVIQGIGKDTKTMLQAQ